MVLSRLTHLSFHFQEVRTGAPPAARVQVTREQTPPELFGFSVERFTLGHRCLVRGFVSEDSGQETPDVLVVGRSVS